MSTPRPNDYVLKAMDKLNSSKQHRVGAGWLETDGSVSIILDRFIVLSGKDDMMLKLFPKDKP